MGTASSSGSTGQPASAAAQTADEKVIDLRSRRGPVPAEQRAEAAVSVRGLVKRYGEYTAVAGIDLDVRRGEIFALLGPNGAGKTTTLEILEGYRDRDGGTVSVLGTDPEQATMEWRSRIGLVLQESRMPPELTVTELVDRYAGYYPDPRDVDETIELVGLIDKRHARAGRLSGGQQRRLDVALALVGDPELVFLDEPTTGFDPAARRAAWSMIENLGELGKTVLLTTHYMDEAEELADRIAILVAGRIAAEGPPTTIGGREHAPAEIRFRPPPGYDTAALGDVETRWEEDYVVVTAADTTATLGQLLDWARHRDADLSGLEVRRPSLEDIYLTLAEQPS